MNNNPVKYTDPSGHVANACLDNGWCGKTGNGLDLNFTGYTGWERRALEKLYLEGGTEAMHQVDFILENKIHIVVDTGWQTWGGATGAWFDENSNTIILNSDPNAGSVNANGQPTTWGLSLIVHEARHLEQGSELSHSKIGEMDAWQVQFRVVKNLGGNLLGWQMDIMFATDLKQFVDLVKTNNSDYWQRPGLGIGLYTYPDYPEYCWGPSDLCNGLISKPWWLRLNLP